jgi:hypothetical protein
MADHICFLAPLKTRVNLGFYHGAHLPDPDHLLAGTGKNLRHVKLNTPEDVDVPALRTLIEAAMADRAAASAGGQD